MSPIVCLELGVQGGMDPYSNPYTNHYGFRAQGLGGNGSS